MTPHANDILLGFEVGSGKAVRVPFAHTVVCGQTQASGKTTTLEAMLSRTGNPLRPALAFLTKRAESAFVGAHSIPPYFRDRADWQFVESILEAMMRERMKYQREWIIRVCQGAKSLEQVAANVEPPRAEEPRPGEACRIWVYPDRWPGQLSVGAWNEGQREGS